MQKLKIKIIGKKLYDIGYRIPLINKALSLGVNNFNTFNIDLDGTQAVIAIIEADDEIIDEFKDFINTSHPEKAVIEKVLFEEYKNNVPPIQVVPIIVPSWKLSNILLILCRSNQLHIDKLIGLP